MFVNICQCGCGKEIEWKYWHEWKGCQPRYIWGHTNQFKKGNLINLGRHHSEETKSKMAISAIGKNLGKHHSEETLMKMRGRKLNEEVKKRMSLSHFGLNSWMKGKTAWNKGILHSEETKEKMRLKRLGTKHSEQTKQKLKLARLKARFSSKNTSIELALQKELNNRGILFTKHKEVLGRPDIFIEPNICIFADGDYWHNRVGIPERDAKVSNGLRESGYLVLRYWEKEIKANAEGCVDEIEEVLITTNNLAYGGI